MSELSKGNSFQILSSDDEEHLSRQQANEHNDFEWDNTGIELQQQKVRSSEKRPTSDNSEEYVDDKGFITVRRKNKKIARSYSEVSDSDIQNMRNINNSLFEVCLTSTKTLPKQIALAKLLNAENITEILRIKYKGPYKVLVKFEKKEEADKLLNCQKIKEMGCKCQMMDEMNFSYGIVKHIDIELKEEEMLEIFQCQNKIVSVKRLKRLTGDGKWVDCETIRMCFQSSTLPSYINGYGCRFKVEPYTFPVTQCSGCWKYGHIIRFCPTKKILCPKCGNDHVNCETTNYSCLNCRGNHMALDKSCPVFAKEKEIRRIMSTEHCSYRKAFEKFEDKKRTFINEFTSECSDIENESPKYKTKPTYRDIVMTKAIVHKESSQTTKQNTNGKKAQTTKNGKKNKKKIPQETDLIEYLNVSNDAQEEQLEEENFIHNKEKKKESTIKRIFKRVKEIVFSENKFHEKIKQFVNLAIEEFTKLIGEIIEKGNIFQNLMSFVNG